MYSFRHFLTLSKFLRESWVSSLRSTPAVRQIIINPHSFTEISNRLSTPIVNRFVRNFGNFQFFKFLRENLKFLTGFLLWNFSLSSLLLSVVLTSQYFNWLQRCKSPLNIWFSARCLLRRCYVKPKPSGILSQ